MKPCWHDVGLTEEGAEIAEEIVEGLVDLLATCHDKEHIVTTALKEAVFRRVELPKRTMEFQTKYVRANGEPCRCSNPSEACVYFGGLTLSRRRYCRAKP